MDIAVFFNIKYKKEYSNLGGKWEITLSNIPLKSCKNQNDAMCHQL